jgi:hypothetical protein
MGEALLKHHSIGGSPYHPIGYFAVRNRTGFRVPSEDPAFIDEFRVAAAVTRTTEPGLSIAIPFVRDDIALGDMVPYVVRN